MQNSKGLKVKEKGDPCPVCGRLVPRRKGRGRPRVYCDATCKRVYDLLSGFGAQIDKTRGRLTKKAARELRREIWALGNRLKVSSK